MSVDLRTFITLLECECQIFRVKAAVDPTLEIAAITDRICKQPCGGNALLFEKPGQSIFPVATNLFGSYLRSSLALGVSDLEELTVKTSDLLSTIPVLDPKKIDLQISTLKNFTKFKPIISKALWQENSTISCLNDFPFLQNWENDGIKSTNARYITFGQIFTALPDGSAPNCGMYRAQIIGANQLAIRWGSFSGAARHLMKYRELNKCMPVAVTLGGNPALIFSSMMPLPGNLDEQTFAGFLCSSPLMVAPCSTIPLYVPSSAEVVFEGSVDPSESFEEGPFGNHTGYYSATGSAAVMHIHKISFRPNAIIPATIVGPPPMEDCWMSKAWERVLLAIIKKIVPDIHDIYIPLEWSFHQSAIISLESPHSGMVREISAIMWRLPWFASSKILLFVSSETPIGIAGAVSWTCINELDLCQDMIICDDNQRFAFDATGGRIPRTKVKRTDSVESLVSRRWKEYGFV